MSNIPIGTLVMLQIPEAVLSTMSMPPWVPNGTVGEVVDSSKYSKEIAIGEVGVDFPSHQSGLESKLWKVPSVWLIPLSGPELLDEDVVDNPYNTPYEKVVVDTA